jgi:hypothetical protein
MKQRPATVMFLVEDRDHCSRFAGRDPTCHHAQAPP